MFCNKCGKEIPDNAKFCNYCGARFGESASEMDERTAVKPRSKPSVGKKTWIVLAAAIVIVAAGIGGYKFYTSPSQKMNREIKSGDYSAALEIYQDDLEQAALSSKSIKLLNTALTELQTAYDEETLAYEEILENLDILSEFSDREFRKSVSTVKESIVTQHKVANFVTAAEAYMQEERYTAAIDNYNSAVAIDPTAQTAIDGLERAYDLYRNAILKSAAEYEEKEDFLSAQNALEIGLSYIKNDSTLLNELDALQKRYDAYCLEQDIADVIAQATTLLSDRQYEEALAYIVAALERYPENEALLSAYDETYAAIPNLLIEEATEYSNRGDFWNAIWILAHGKERYPDAKEIQNLCQNTLIEYLQSLEAEYNCVLHYDGHLYCQFQHSSDFSYEQVEAEWELLGAHLATITSKEENTAVYEHLRSCGWENAYFGLSDAEKEGTWVWCTGEPFSYSNWGSDNEPNGGTRENYGMYYQVYSDGTWNDYSFNAATGYIVEWDTDFLTEN